MHPRVSLTRSSDKNSVSPSVCQTRALWQNGRKICLVFSERELKFMFAICHRRSVCRLSVCLSVVCDVRAPYSDD